MLNTEGVRETISCPNGFYFGDPCYAMGDKEYDELIDQMFATDHRGVVGRFDIAGSKVIVDNTAYGDGEYPGRNFNYGVDAGMLGIVPMELVDGDVEDSGWVYDKPARSVTLETSTDGSFKVIVDGKVLEYVETDSSYDEEEEDEDDWN